MLRCMIGQPGSCLLVMTTAEDLCMSELWADLLAGALRVALQALLSKCWGLLLGGPVVS